MKKHMFDDVNNQGKQTTPGGAQEPIDIFSEADTSAPAAGEIAEEGVKSPGFPVKIVAIIAGAVVVLGIAGFGIYQFVLKKPVSTPEPVPAEEILDTEQSTNETTNTEETTNAEQPAEQPGGAIPIEADQSIQPPTPVVPPVPVNVAPPADSDGDGLTDEEEARYGTDKNVVDTDNDGLSDREEMQVYKTNPSNPDTDGDGFSDGTEVKGGYNPNGPGKLVTIPTEQSAPSLSAPVQQ